MPALAFAVPMAGASVTNVFRPTLDGVNAAGSYYDKYAPFALGTVSWITPVTAAPGTPNNRVIAKFCRCSAVVAIGGTTGIGTDGVATGAGVFTNDTGVALAIGDYVWLTGGVTPVLAADEAAAPSRGAKAGETEEERKLREAEEAEYQKAERERNHNKKAHA